jgi:hypothetical protein
MDERPIPPDVFLDENAVEMLRVWIAHRQLYCSLKIGMYHDSGKISEGKAWGTILADAARHVANAMHERNSQDPNLILNHIAISFLKELKIPTTEVEGDFL